MDGGVTSRRATATVARSSLLPFTKCATKQLLQPEAPPLVSSNILFSTKPGESPQMQGGYLFPTHGKLCCRIFQHRCSCGGLKATSSSYPAISMNCSETIPTSLAPLPPNSIWPMSIAIAMAWTNPQHLAGGIVALTIFSALFRYSPQLQHAGFYHSRSFRPRTTEPCLSTSTRNYFLAVFRRNSHLARTPSSNPGIMRTLIPDPQFVFNLLLRDL
jgi:hypothetical protein